MTGYRVLRNLCWGFGVVCCILGLSGGAATLNLVWFAMLILGLFLIFAGNIIDDMELDHIALSDDREPPPGSYGEFRRQRQQQFDEAYADLLELQAKANALGSHHKGQEL